MIRDVQVWMPLVGITLPIVITILVITILFAAWLHSKRLDSLETSLNRRMDDLWSAIREIRAEIRDIRAEIRDIRSEILGIHATLKDLDRRVTLLEEPFCAEGHWVTYRIARSISSASRGRAALNSLAPFSVTRTMSSIRIPICSSGI